MSSNLPNYRYRGVIENWVDGDTVDVSVDLGFCVYTKIRFRLTGLDTAELKSKDDEKALLAAKAHNFVQQWAPKSTVVYIASTKTEKFGRWLAEIFKTGMAGESVNDALLREGLAKPYKGGAKE